MRILSWDVGIHNLSYCILERDDDTILEDGKQNEKIDIKHWGIINLAEDPIQKKNMTYIFENIPKKLDEKPELLDKIDIVCIENQPTLKNPTMKSVQMILYSYFLIRGKTDNKEYPIKQISFISATNKLKVYQGPYVNPDLYTKSGKLKNIPKPKVLKGKGKGKNQPLILEFLEISDNKEEEIKAEPEIIDETCENNDSKKPSAVCYGDKKKLAILYTREMVKQDHNEFLDYFESNNKKDDLSDSFLQGMYVLKIKNQSTQKTEVSEEQKKKKQPRRKKNNVLSVMEKNGSEEEVKPKQIRKRVSKTSKLQSTDKKVDEEAQSLNSEGAPTGVALPTPTGVALLTPTGVALPTQSSFRAEEVKPKRGRKKAISKEEELKKINLEQKVDDAYLSDSSIEN